MRKAKPNEGGDVNSAAGQIKRRYRMVMFDMDGTILDSYGLHARCFQRFLKRYGVRLGVDETARLMGNTIKVILSNTLPEQRHETALHELSDFYLTQVDDLVDGVQMISGSVQTITSLKDQGLLVTLLTNSKKELVQRISEKKGFHRLFDMIEAADNGSLGKETRCRGILDRFGILPKDVLYVGDMSHDVALARSTGMTVCLVDNDISWLHHEGLSVEDIRPDIVVSDVSEVPGLISF